MEKIELEFGPDGIIRTIYKDDSIEELSQIPGMRVLQVDRASKIEWENHGVGLVGWVVRAAHNPNLAIRSLPNDPGLTVSIDGRLAFFQKREDALREEQRFFWQLLPPRKEVL
jgi:hypothetical protein